jgi:hypothetical protein
VPTVVKTWVFLADAEGLADTGNHANIAFAYDGADGSPASGSVKFTCTTNSLTAAVERARRAATGQTWETWGVPAGATVTGLQITSYRKKRSLDINSDATVKFRVVNSSAATVHSAGELESEAIGGGTTDISWQTDVASPSRAVDASYQASTTDVRMEIEVTLNTGGTTSISLAYDTIELTITYSAGVPVGEQVPIWTPLLIASNLRPVLNAPRSPQVIGQVINDISLYGELAPIHQPPLLLASPIERVHLWISQPVTQEAIPPPPISAVGKFWFSNVPDMRGRAWRTETVVAENTDENSGAGVWVGNSYVALYSIDGQVRMRRGGNPLDWTDATDRVVEDVLGQVWDAAVNEAGIIVALINEEWYVSRDLGLTFELGGTGGWPVPAAITTVRHLFVVSAPSGAVMSHWISEDGGGSFA